MSNSNISTGLKRNRLLRYKAIKEDYDHYRRLGVPTTVIWRDHIYPKYFISRTTLYTILCTPINKELAELPTQNQLQLF